MTQAQSLADLSQIAALSALGNRNYIVDGNFDNWINVGSVASAVGGVINTSATMFYILAGTAGVINAARSPLETSKSVPGLTTPAPYCLLVNQTTAATATPAIAQHIESALTLQGRSATFSCWLWTPSGTVTIPSITAGDSTGSGGSPSPPPTPFTATLNWVVTTTPQRFSVRLDLPSVTGLTLGTNNDHYLNLGIFLPSGQTFQLITTQWQLEPCPPGAPPQGLPTQFEYRGQQAELARVQRYYEVLQNATMIAYSYGAQGNVNCFPFPFRTTKRANPAISYGTFTTANCNVAPGSVANTDICSLNPTITGSGGATPYSFNNTTPTIADCRL
jgi:hypothetical protein